MAWETNKCEMALPGVRPWPSTEDIQNLFVPVDSSLWKIVPHVSLRVLRSCIGLIQCKLVLELGTGTILSFPGFVKASKIPRFYLAPRHYSNHDTPFFWNLITVRKTTFNGLSSLERAAATKVHRFTCLVRMLLSHHVLGSRPISTLFSRLHLGKLLVENQRLLGIPKNWI